MRMLGMLLAVAGVLALTWPASADQITVTFVDTPAQDPLPNGTFDVHELGLGPPFRESQWILGGSMTTDYRPCLENYDNPTIPNALVAITNVSGRVWDELFYVADPETTLANDDGFVNGGLAFRIDWIGANTPLVYESMTADAILEVGEVWKFVIQDYTNSLGLYPHDFWSIGAGNQSAGVDLSSGSIITPEPGTFLLLALVGLTLLRRRMA